MERQKTEFWNGKKVFLTGHTGFKGAWLSLWLEYLGANVSGYSLRPAEGGIFQRLANNLKVASYFNDIRDINAVRAAMKETKPDIVIHMASQPLVRESYVNPEETFETNIMGTVNLLQAAREVENIAAVLVVTSDKCYRNNGLGQFFVETDPLGGHDPYSSSKACQDLIAQSFRDSYFSDSKGFFPALATARAGNVIGGGDVSKDRLLPDMINLIKNNKKLKIRNPDAVRPWQHVLDPLSGYLKLCQKLVQEPDVFSGAWNFGPSMKKQESVRAVISEFCKCWGVKNEFEFMASADVYEAEKLGLDVQKASKNLSWTTIYDMRAAVLKTVEWEKSAILGAEMTEFTISQIRDYSNNAY